MTQKSIVFLTVGLTLAAAGFGVDRGVACAGEVRKRMCGNGEAGDSKGWRVGEVGGAPGLLRGGRPVAPFLFWQAVPEEEDVRALSAAGVGFYSCFTAGLHYKNPYWREDGRVAPEFQERTLDALFGWNPSAAVLPRLFATAPDWWIAANPGEAVRWSNPHPAPGRDVPVRESFASRKARDEVAPRYAEAVRQLMAKYGDRLMGIHVTNGPWGENFSWEAFTIAGWPDYPAEESGFGDVSAAMTAAFRGYLREKYGTVGALRKAWRDDGVDFSTAEVPGMAERFRLNGEGWRDPAAGRRVPDYFECMNRVTVDMLDFYAGIVKEVSGGRLPTVVFYGYTQDERRTLECDHRAISRAYRSRNLDCFSAPHTYHRRRPGEDGEMRQYLASAALHGKLFIDEGDDMTYLERLKESPDCRAFSKDVDESLAVLYREFGMTLTHGVGLWFMDLTGGNFRDRRIVDAVGRCRRWSEESLALPRTHLSEVAVISQPESEFYMGYRQTPANRISEALYLEEMGAYYRTGAPFDWYLAEDLEAVRARKYKVVALLDCEYLSAEQYATLLKMKEEGVRFVFYHAPGYVSQTDLDWGRVRALTGGEEYRDLRRHSAAELRGIFREAGVHVYTDTDDVVLSANESHVMLHSRKAGDYVVRLKGWSAAEELVSGREVEVRDGCCTIRMDACRTAILRRRTRNRPLTAADIQIRDPFVVTDAANGRYLLLSSYFVPTADNFGFLGTGAKVYETRDLKSFMPAKPVLDIPEEFGCKAFWAPEMHRFRGKWYLFGTVNYRRGTAPGKGERGTWTFVSDSMEGPFRPTGTHPVTPVDWNALDGTFWEEDGKPYMVFCHEWTQIGNGEMCLVQLTDDLSAAVGEPKTLFKATDYTPTPSNDSRNRIWDTVTDGPFLHRSPTSGKLYMIWANVRRQGYAEIVCESVSGKVAGPWTNFRLLFERNGGHGMLFRKLDGTLALALHQPNNPPNERPRFFDIEESGGSLRIRSNADK